MNDQLTSELATLAATILASVLSIVVPFVGLQIKKYFGERTAKILQEMLHQAIWSGVLQATGATPEIRALEAVAYARKGSAEVLAKIGASDGALMALARAKVADLARQPNP